MKKNTKIYLICVTIGVLLVFLLTAFVHAEFNPFNWTMDQRAFLAFMVALIVCSLAPINIDH